jgi:hypothetical protein
MQALFSDLFVKNNDDVTWLFQLDLFIIQPTFLTIPEHLLDER